MVMLFEIVCQKQVAAFQRLQTRARKVIKKAKITKILGHIPEMSVENIVCFDMNAMTYKVIHKLCLEMYKPRSSFSSYNARSSQNLHILKHRTESVQ